MGGAESPEVMGGESCLFDGCDRLARPGFALCRGHEKQKELGKPLTRLRDYGVDPWRWLIDAARRYLDAESRNDKRKQKAAKELVRFHATAWVTRSKRR